MLLTHFISFHFLFFLSFIHSFFAVTVCVCLRPALLPLFHTICSHIVSGSVLILFESEIDKNNFLLVHSSPFRLIASCSFFSLLFCSFNVIFILMFFISHLQYWNWNCFEAETSVVHTCARLTFHVAVICNFAWVNPSETPVWPLTCFQISWVTSVDWVTVIEENGWKWQRERDERQEMRSKQMLLNCNLLVHCIWPTHIFVVSFVEQFNFTFSKKNLIRCCLYLIKPI